MTHPPSLNVMDLAERGLGSLLWVMNNRHNWADSRWDALAEAAEDDARKALAALSEWRTARRESEIVAYCATCGTPQTKAHFTRNPDHQRASVTAT